MMDKAMQKNFKWIAPSVCAGTGFPSPADDYIEHPLDWNAFLMQHPAASFTVRVMGESMAPMIPDGAHVIVDKSLTPKNGDVVIAIYNGEFTLKQYTKRGQTQYLIPNNPQFPTVQIKSGDAFEIWGVVTFSVHTHR